ncbi:hypothetical protein DPEC_G00258640 [Dallia pectoralis]|uniref:Uncharacterized protein n=1 Tax=Dallia pectoralis TaxID=75939 RepID=A0ACC2FR32_DALPE|nr:hypothetical protein DPEC_G00258640 [Dallia pectoralis]
MKLKRVNKFHKRIAEGIPRPWHIIYYRGRTCFDPNNYKGRFTEDELQSLITLQALHGNSWSKISELTDRSTTALKTRFSCISEKAGPWTETEFKRLMDTMQELLAGQAETSNGRATIRKEKIYKDVPWTAVSERVKTRHWAQCRGKWMEFLKKKMSHGQTSFAKRVRSIQIKVHLIKELYELQVEDVVDINWDELALKIGDVTPHSLQKHFYRLKLAKVPLWQNKTFCDIMDFLSSKVLPKYEDYLHKAGLDLESESRAEPQEFLVLSDIFNDLEDCDHDDLADE